MEQLLLHLRNLGFTEMESKIMVELATKGEASGYEVAKQLGVSRSMCMRRFSALHSRVMYAAAKGSLPATACWTRRSWLR